MIFRSPRNPWWFIVHPSTTEPGRFQLTGFDKDGPMGHTVWDTAEQAAASACGRFVNGEPPVGDRTFHETTD